VCHFKKIVSTGARAQALGQRVGTDPVKTPRWSLPWSSTKKQIESWVWQGVELATTLMFSPILNESPCFTCKPQKVPR
jgi:hypothetical protein